MQLIVSSNSALAPLTFDLSGFVDVQQGEGMDPSDPAFREALISHSLLKEGGVLALEDLKAKELIFPLRLNAPASGMTNLVADPSFNYDPLGQAPALWTGVPSGPMGAGSSTLAVSAAQAQRGSQSMAVSTVGGNAGQGARIALGTVGSGQAVTASVWVYVPSTQTMTVEMEDDLLGNGGQAHSVSCQGGQWTQLTVTWTPTGNSTHAMLYVFTGSSSAAQTFYVDAAMVVAGTAVPAYADGDSFGWNWNGPPGNSSSTGNGGSSQLAQMISDLNQAITSPGATLSWQDDGMSQPTVFDGISGQFDVQYNYREAQNHWCSGRLRFFAQPFGRAAGPRAYAAASGVGPLLMISAFASSGQNILGASGAGWGGVQQPSGGVQYFGDPFLQGDAPALLQVSYVGPLPNTATNTGVVPYAAVSVLPDRSYQPLITAPQISFVNLNASTNRRNSATAVASQYLQLGTTAQTVQDILSFTPLGAPSDLVLDPTAAWAGSHRLFAIARASSAKLSSGLTATLATLPGPLVQNPQQVTLAGNNSDWGLYDLGVFALRASEVPQAPVQVEAQLTTGASSALDVGALVMLPDSTTWFLNPTGITPSQYGYPPNLASAWGAAQGVFTNTILLDDTVGEQFLYSGQSQVFAPSPIGSVPSASRITQYSRGLVPRLRPQQGIPAIAIVGVGQTQDPAVAFTSTSAQQSFSALAGAGADSASNGGTVAWSNPANVTAWDGQYATCALTVGAVSHLLEATQFGFNIPAGAAIQGISVTFVKTAAGVIRDSQVSLVKAGAVQTANRAQGGWPTSPAYVSYGGANDLWGGAWTPSDINNSGFGVALAAAGNQPAGGTASVDVVAILVYFTLGGTNQFYGASQLNPQNQRTMAQVSVLERTKYVLG